MLEYDFQKPEDWCYGTDFWMLNDELDETEMCRQLQSMHSQGVACVIVRTYLGLKSDYPGKDWMSKMHAAVTQAKKLGMKLVMQAGYMPEAVLGLPEEYSMGNLCCYPQGQGQGEVVHCHNGIDYCVKPTGHVLDMLSPQACQFYVQQSYENFWKDFREEFGKTIVSVWVDEPSFKAASLPFTKELPKAYEALWKEPFAWDKVHLLFTDDDRKEVIASVDDRLNQNTEENADEGELFRLHYWRTVLYLMKQSYFQSVRDWCDANHLMFSGHLMAEDTMEGQISATCFTMPMYRYFDIPGMDYLTAQMDWNYGALRPERPYNDLWTHYGYFNTPLQCSSVAHQTGKKAVLSEMYGVSSENMGFRDQKYMFDRLASFGINHRSVHAIFYSLRGCGKHAYPPHVSDYQPYWPKYRLLTDAIARESSFLRAGKPVKDVLVLHPIETAFSLYHGRNERGVNDNQKLWRYDPEFNQVLRNLANWQINFELGDEDTIAELGEVSSNRFRVGQMAYKLVVIPPVKFLRETTLALLGKFMEQGGTVLVIGQGSKYSDTGRLCKEALEGAVFADSFR